jgi:hypothetical protein
MLKKIAVFGVSVFLLLNLCGCFALFAGAVGGAGTAVWLSGKLTQQFNASYARTVSATESALKSLSLEIVKEEKEANVTAFRSKYTDGKEIWIDVKRITEVSTKVEVRVGAVNPDKEACNKILNRIKESL